MIFIILSIDRKQLLSSKVMAQLTENTKIVRPDIYDRVRFLITQLYVYEFTMVFPFT
jgi:hypothetical protein